MDITSLPAHLLAWQFLRRNPKYRSNWKKHQKKPRAVRRMHGFPVYQQTSSDLAAERWGLLAFAPPETAANDAPPFWSIGPTLDAEPIPDSDTPLLPLLRQSKVCVSGLRLLDNSTVLFIQRKRASIQVRLREKLLSGDDWGLSLKLPVELKLPVLLNSAQVLWNIVREEPLKNLLPISRRTSLNCSLPLTA